jgi:hypothetical protein
MIVREIFNLNLSLRNVYGSTGQFKFRDICTGNIAHLLLSHYLIIEHL